jgi:hypothetical protein
MFTKIATAAVLLLSSSVVLAQARDGALLETTTAYSTPRSWKPRAALRDGSATGAGSSVYSFSTTRPTGLPVRRYCKAASC